MLARHKKDIETTELNNFRTSLINIKHNKFKTFDDLHAQIIEGITRDQDLNTNEIRLRSGIHTSEVPIAQVNTSQDASRNKLNTSDKPSTPSQTLGTALSITRRTQPHNNFVGRTSDTTPPTIRPTSVPTEDHRHEEVTENAGTNWDYPSNIINAIPDLKNSMEAYLHHGQVQPQLHGVHHESPPLPASPGYSSRQDQDHPRHEQLPEVRPQDEKKDPVAKITSPQQDLQTVVQRGG